ASRDGGRRDEPGGGPGRQARPPGRGARPTGERGTEPAPHRLAAHGPARPARPVLRRSRRTPRPAHAPRGARAARGRAAAVEGARVVPARRLERRARLSTSRRWTGAPLGPLAVVGAGQIGGSVALAARAAGAVTEVVGWSRNAENLERARALGIIDRVAASRAEVARGAALVALATPVGSLGEV